MPIVFINSWLENCHSNFSIKDMATCEHYTLTISHIDVQSSHVAWMNTPVRKHLIGLLAHEVKNHKLDVCCKISPPSNQQLVIVVFMHVQKCFELSCTIFLFRIKIHVVQFNTMHIHNSDINHTQMCHKPT